MDKRFHIDTCSYKLENNRVCSGVPNVVLFSIQETQIKKIASFCFLISTLKDVLSESTENVF